MVSITITLLGLSKKQRFMTVNFLADIASGVLLADGAIGTVLKSKGFAPPFETLNLTHPDLIQSLHRAYYEAGARVIYTNTFGVTSLQLKNLKTELDPGILLRQAVELARAAIGDEAYVAGCVGPVGLSLAELKIFSGERLKLLYSHQVAVLAGAGVDLIVFETFYSLIEIQIALLACERAKPITTPLVVSVTVEKDGFLADGTSLKDWVRLLDEAVVVDVIGLNCSHGPLFLAPVVDSLCALTCKPILLKPNAGLPQENAGQLLYPFAPEDFAMSLKAMKQPQIRILGGCCGTTPEFIKELSRSS